MSAETKTCRVGGDVKRVVANLLETDALTGNSADGTPDMYSVHPDDLPHLVRTVAALLAEQPGGAPASAPHCETCICGRRAPVQGQRYQPATAINPGRAGRAAGTVSWAEHLEAYSNYAGRYGNRQSAERLAERGGFGYREITDFLGHEPRTWSSR